MLIDELNFYVIELGQTFPYQKVAHFVSFKNSVASAYISLNVWVQQVGMVFLGTMRFHADVMNNSWSR